MNQAHRSPSTKPPAPSARGGRLWSAGRSGAAALVLSAGLSIALGAAQPEPGNPSQGQQPEPTTPEPAPPEGVPEGMDAEKAEMLRQVEAARRAAREAARRQLEEAARKGEGGVEAVPAVPAAPGHDLPGVGAMVGKDEEVSLSFPEPVDILAFADFVGRVLNLNIISDEGISAGRIVFRAPMKVRSGDLLKLLARLLEDHDLVFSRDPLGFYTIKSSGKTPILLSDVASDLATTKVIPTPMVRPSTMQSAVQQTMGGQGGAVQGLRITAVDDIGVLIVTASSGVIATVEQMVQTITGEMANQKLHRFALENVSADFALNRILLLNGKGTQGGLPGQAPAASAPGGGGVSGSLTHLDSRLFIDPGNAIIFRGTDAEAAEVKGIIAIVDSVTPLIARRYLTGSVTSEVASAGERIGLGPITQTSSGGLGGFGAVPSGRANNFAGGTAPGGVTGDLPGSGFTVDVEKGSIIYYGTAAQHREVARLVATFTEQALSEDVEIRAYKLLYAKAETVANVLNSLLQNPQDRTASSAFLPRGSSRGTASPLVTPRTPEAPAAAGGEESATLTASSQDTVVVADEDRNQILVKAAGRQQREFERIIRKLDERQPQVYIEAKIVAVRLDNTFSYRADLQIDADAFQFLSGFGLTSPPGTAGLFNDRRSIPAPTGVSGVTAALLNQDRVLGVLNALQVVGDAKIVSTPRILVNDNQEATQASTREEPFSATSQVSGSPTITSQGGVAEAGTKLTVKPTISQNGDIILEYEVELSNFDRSAAQANSNLQPPKQQEKYKSKVTIPSDSTIVVGGFSFESRQQTENKVPFLGDIPLVGLLFKSIGQATNKTTIFVFITPRVLNDPTGADLRILTEGPARDVNVEGPAPEFVPDTIAISPGVKLPELDLETGRPRELDPAYSRRRELPNTQPR